MQTLSVHLKKSAHAPNSASWPTVMATDIQSYDRRLHVSQLLRLTATLMSLSDLDPLQYKAQITMLKRAELDSICGVPHGSIEIRYVIIAHMLCPSYQQRYYRHRCRAMMRAASRPIPNLNAHIHAESMACPHAIMFPRQHRLLHSRVTARVYPAKFGRLS